MDLVNFLVVSFLSAVALQTFAFGVAMLRNNRYDFIDVAWGLSFVAIAISSYALSENKDVFKLGVLVLVIAWAVRLSWHIFFRWLKSDEEDRRYVNLRSKWPKSNTSLQMYFRVFLVQALLACLVALPIIVSMSSESSSLALFIAGTSVWLAGYVFESVGDWQLRRFIADPRNKGKLMTSGLWAVSRHPNYFGEILIWWGFAIIALGSDHGWVGIIGASAITYLLVYISGVPLSEKALSSKPGWDEYKKKTPVLVPFTKN